MRQEGYEVVQGICELKNLQDPQVEHLLPHKNGNTLNENLTGTICFGHAVTAME